MHRIKDNDLPYCLANTKLIAFDVDGTLTDTIDIIVECFETTFDRAHLPIPTVDEIKATIGMSLGVAITSLVPNQDPDLGAKVTDIYRQTFVQTPRFQEVRMFDGVMEMLSKLKRQGFLLAIMTGKARPGINRIFEAFPGFEDMFSIVMTGDMGKTKPDPYNLEFACKELGISKDQTLMVGDAILDIQMAQNANVAALGVTTGVATFDDLEQIGTPFILERVTDIVNYI